MLGGGGQPRATEAGMNQKQLCQQSPPALTQRGPCLTCPVAGAWADGDVWVLPHLPFASS